MISVPVILTFALALFLTLLFPIMLILILAWKKKISLLPLGIWPIELLLFALALLCGFLFRKSRSWFPNAETGGAGTS